jgi:DNA-binding transcriptional LysR family regulator
VTSDDLQLLLALLEHGNLTAAAAALGVDRTTVGRRLDQIEERLRATLFVRTRAGLRATAAAQRLGARAENILRELRELETSAVAPESAVRGLVRVAASEGIASQMVKRGLLRLAAHHPELTFELVPGNRPVDLEKGEADLALRTIRPRAGGAHVRKLATLRLTLYGSPAYLRERGTPTSLADLAGHDVLVPSGELARLPEARLLARAPGVRVVLRSQSFPVLVQAAVAGAGLVAVTDAWAKLMGLTPVLDLPEIPPRPIWLAVAPGQRDRSAVRVVAEEIARLFADIR